MSSCPLGGSWDPSHHSPRPPQMWLQALQELTGKNQRDGSAQVKPSPRWSMGWQRRKRGGKPSSEPGPTTPLVRACLSASLSGLTVVTAAAAVGGSVCLSLCVKKYETELFFILELCCCSHDIKNKKIYFWSSILSLTLGSFCCPDSGRLPCLQAACKIQPGTRYGGRPATCARAKCLFGGGKCFADEMI